MYTTMRYVYVQIAEGGVTNNTPTHGRMTHTDPRRWVLKCPLHILMLKELLTVFPDAKLVW